ncbi:MAG: DnaA ATPase domain-containing protein [Planctomycetales bacterium]
MRQWRPRCCFVAAGRLRRRAQGGGGTMQPERLPQKSAQAIAYQPVRDAEVCGDAARGAESRDVEVCRVVTELVGRSAFEHWFQGKTQVLVAGDELTVRAASPFLLKWLQKQFRTPLGQAALQLCGPAGTLRFETGSVVGVGGMAAAGHQTPERAQTPASVRSADQPEDPEVTPSIASIPIVASDAVLATRSAGRRFADLADFVVGPGNELAVTAVRQVCGRPDGGGGPLFVYGPVGMGKSHLLEGMHRALRRGHPHLHVVFLASEQFANYFTQAYRDHSLPAFRQRFRTVDVLLVDDVEFFEGKRAIQEEFLHTVKQLESHGKLVVASGDRHPRLITRLCDELKTRFLSGMVCRLEPPDLETRERIVFAKAQRLEAEVSPEALRYVAQRFSGSVRELEGALHCLKICHTMTGKRVGVTAARQVLSDLERDCLRTVRLADVERVVCSLYGLAPEELRSDRRTRAISEPRMLAMFLARRHTRSAYSEIGSYFGGRNHATVIAAERKVAQELERGAEVTVASRSWLLQDVVDALEQQLLAG